MLRVRARARIPDTLVSWMRAHAGGFGPACVQDCMLHVREESVFDGISESLCTDPRGPHACQLVKGWTGHGLGPFTDLRYFDYCITCPLITLDLLSNVNAPYSYTLSAMVLVCLTCAVASSAVPAPASFAWFGMGMLLFAFTYHAIVKIVNKRLNMIGAMASDINTKKSIKFLRTGCYIFFTVWLLYPVLWVLGKDALNVVSQELDHIFTAILDVFAKSAYGFAILYFRTYFDMKLEVNGIPTEALSELSHAQMTDLVGLVAQGKVSLGTAIKYVAQEGSEGARQEADRYSQLHQTPVYDGFQLKDKGPSSSQRGMTGITYSARACDSLMNVKEHAASTKSLSGHTKGMPRSTSRGSLTEFGATSSTATQVEIPH